MPPPLNVLVIDSHPLYAEGISASLSNTGITIQFEYSSSYTELPYLLSTYKPDLVFLELDLDNPRYNGFTICTEITSKYANTFVCILSRYNSVKFISKALECGAKAYLDKSNNPETLREFMHDFYQGRISRFHTRVAEKRMFSHSSNPEAFELRELLTRREKEVMDLILDGLSHKEIEQKLHISYDTYRTHHKAVLSKLSVQNDVQLTKLAIQHNLTDIKYKGQRDILHKD